MHFFFLFFLKRKFIINAFPLRNTRIRLKSNIYRVVFFFMIFLFFYYLLQYYSFSHNRVSKLFFSSTYLNIGTQVRLFSIFLSVKKNKKQMVNVRNLLGTRLMLVENYNTDQCKYEISSKYREKLKTIDFTMMCFFMLLICVIFSVKKN